MILLIIAIFLICLIAIYFLISYNIIISARNIVKEAFSTMDVYLKKRWELLPNLVETVKGYSNYETNVLEEIIKLRTDNYDSLTNMSKIDLNEKVSSNINNFFAVSENYPQLKASENFLNLSKELVKLEDEIANSRKYYNGAVRDFNNKVLMFPNNIVARIFGIKEEKMFEINENEKESVRVNW